MKRIETKVEKSSTEGKDEIGDIPVGLWDDLATTFYVHNDISDDEFIIWVKSFDRSTSYRKTKENAKRAGRMLVPNRAEQSQEKFSWGEYGYQKIWVKNRYRQANYLRESLNRNKIPNHASEARLKRALNSKLRNAKGFLEQLIADQA